MVEQSLWAAVPNFLRRMSRALKAHTGKELPLHATPIKFGSWMGGDRDGNPNVTAKTTHYVCTLGKWMAADLYLREVDVLRFELSMNNCSDLVWRMAHKILEANKVREDPRQEETTRLSEAVANSMNDTGKLPEGEAGGVGEAERGVGVRWEQGRVVQVGEAGGDGEVRDAVQG